MTAPHLAVLRYGRLGDLVMTEPALRWASSVPGLEVSLVTDSHYVGAFDSLLEGVALCTEVPDCDLVLDLHRVRRSRAARRGRPWLGVGKEHLRRRALLKFPSLGLRPRYSWPERHLAAMELALLQLGCALPSRPGALPRFAPSMDVSGRRLGIVLGAGHATKRWPLRHWEELAGRWRGEVIAFVGPGEEHLAVEAGVQPWPDTSLEGLVDGLSTCEVVAAGDTGPLHLAAALGRSVVGLFGPTPIETGFWVWAGQGTALRSEELSCSPCDLHGTPSCPRGHHRCLEELLPDAVLAALESLAGEQQ
jgi:heptosyltransferase-2